MADSTMQAYEDYLNKAQEYVNNYNPDEKVNYNDERLLNVNTERAQQEANINKKYEDMINNSNKFYQDQINASKEYAQKQSEIQQQNTDFAIEKINQEKEQAGRDYTKEQKGAYTDYQKQTNQYGVNAEQMATSGLRNSGYSESSLASMYNTYQNRVATARDGYNRAVLNYDNAIKDATLANNSALAQIAYNALQQQLELSLQGFQYKNSLVEAKMNEINANNTRYDNKYQNVLAQINQEIANRQSLYNQYSGAITDYKKLVEDIRQFNERMAADKAQREEARRQFEEQMAETRKQNERNYQLQLQKLAEERAARKAASSSSSSILQVQDSSSNSGYEVSRLSNDTIAIKKPNGQYATLKITPDATDEQIYSWGRANGVDLRQYL